MSVTRWTPGPWVWRTFGKPMLVTASGGGKVVIMGIGGTGEIGVRDENGVLVPIHADHPVAHILRAAPDLYEDGHALAMAALQSNRYAEDPDYRDAVDNMLASLAKARGEGA